jgi:hypothetical protein
VTFQQKNISVSLVAFILILGFYLLRLYQISLGGSVDPTDLFRLWGITIVLAIVFTIIGTILTQIVSTIIEAIRTGDDDPEIEDISDERDQLIDLRGTRVTYFVFSIGVLLSMLSFVLGRPALVMFALLILSALIAQIVGDISRLAFYRRGF